MGPSAKHRSEKESDSSNNYPPIIVGPLTTNQDLTDGNGEKIYNLPLMIQQPFLREKKEPIKVDISVKLIPKPRKKDRRRRGQVDEIVVQAEDKGINNSISMEITDGNVHVLKKTEEVIEPLELTSDITHSNNVNEILECDHNEEIRLTAEPAETVNKEPRVNQSINSEQQKEATGINVAEDLSTENAADIRTEKKINDDTKIESGTDINQSNVPRESETEQMTETGNIENS